MWPGEQAPPPLPPPVGKGYDFPAGNPFDWKSRGLRPSRALPGRGGDGFPPHTTLSQIPLKSFGFPGAESARKRFFLRGAGSPPKKSAPGATNRNLRFRLVGREATCLPLGQATFPPRRSPASIGSRECCGPLELSRSILMKILVPDDAERGALCSPTPPRGRDAREFTPSRALPGRFGRRFWFPTEQAGGELLPAALLLPRRFARKFRS